MDAFCGGGFARNHLSLIPGGRYARCGTANLFLVFEPVAGQRRVTVTERRAAVAVAQRLRVLLAAMYPATAKVVLVLDNLHTHGPAAWDEAFAPAAARRLVERLEIHYTPQHARWLHMAATALAVRARQGLDRRIPERAILVHDVAVWQPQRNAAVVKVDGQFTTAAARIKLKRLYPSIQLG